MRLKVEFDSAIPLGELVKYRKALIAVPSTIQSIEDLTCLLCTKFLIDQQLLLSVGGFAVHPGDVIGDVIRNGDIIEVRASRERRTAKVAGVSNKSSTALAALKDLSPGKTLHDSPQKAGKSLGQTVHNPSQKNGSVDEGPVAKRQRVQDSHASSPSHCGITAMSKVDPVAPSNVDELLKLCANKKAQVKNMPNPNGLQQKQDGVLKSNEQQAESKADGASEESDKEHESRENRVTPTANLHPPTNAVVAKDDANGKAPSHTTGSGTSKSYTTEKGCDGDITVRHPVLGELVVLAGQDVDQFVQKKVNKLRAAVRKQIEFYFSAKNWEKDENLREQADDEGFVSFEYIAKFNRMQSLATDAAFIRDSVAASTVVEVSSSKSSLRRRA